MGRGRVWLLLLCNASLATYSTAEAPNVYTEQMLPVENQPILSQLPPFQYATPRFRPESNDKNFEAYRSRANNSPHTRSLDSYPSTPEEAYPIQVRFDPKMRESTNSLSTSEVEENNSALYSTGNPITYETPNPLPMHQYMQFRYAPFPTDFKEPFTIVVPNLRTDRPGKPIAVVSFKPPKRKPNKVSSQPPASPARPETPSAPSAPTAPSAASAPLPVQSAPTSLAPYAASSAPYTAPYEAPSAPYSEPSVQYSVPSAPYAAPSAPYEAPSASYSEPSVQYSVPSAPNEAPSAPYSEPSVQYSAPSAPYAAPSAPYEAPSASYSEPSVQYSVPSAPNEAPSAPYSEPSVQYSAPSAPYAAPSASFVAPYEEPSAPYEAPSVQYSAPSAPYEEPSALYAAPPPYAAPTTPYAATLATEPSALSSPPGRAAQDGPYAPAYPTYYTDAPGSEGDFRSGIFLRNSDISNPYFIFTLVRGRGLFDVDGGGGPLRLESSSYSYLSPENVPVYILDVSRAPQPQQTHI